LTHPHHPLMGSTAVSLRMPRHHYPRTSTPRLDHTRRHRPDVSECEVVPSQQRLRASCGVRAFAGPHGGTSLTPRPRLRRTHQRMPPSSLNDSGNGQPITSMSAATRPLPHPHAPTSTSTTFAEHPNAFRHTHRMPRRVSGTHRSPAERQQGGRTSPVDSEATVKAHLTRVLQRIGVSDRTQAALWSRQNLEHH
jgi:hypothetical protein